MKNITTYVEINERKYKVKFVYQNCSFPLIRMDAYWGKFFGVYWIPFSIGNGHLKPKEVVGWTFGNFHNHAVEYLRINLDTDTDTQKGINNFKKISSLCE